MSSAPHNNIHFCFTTLVYHRRSIATGLAFSSPAFSVVPEQYAERHSNAGENMYIHLKT